MTTDGGDMAAQSLDKLPVEIILQIMTHLDTADAVRLQVVCKHLRHIGRDNKFWRTESFNNSSYLETYMRRRRLQSLFIPGATPRPTTAAPEQWTDTTQTEKTRILANWDPIFPGEKVSWYDEYIQRNAPIVFNWFQQPQHLDSTPSAGQDVEARGIALYRPDDPGDSQDGNTAVLAVAPLDDGSVCLWDVNGVTSRRGAVVARSEPGLLFVDNMTSLSQFDHGATECLSVDSRNHLGLFAVQNHLVEVDLQRMAVVGVEFFSLPITALSASHPAVPLTVGTASGLHLHDTRSRQSTDNANASVDVLKTTNGANVRSETKGPLSILHLPQPGSEEDMSNDIYTAGRISNILEYDRRNMSVIKGSIHSGASLCTLTSLPTPFSSLDSDLRRQGLMSLSQVGTSKSVPGGRTIIAGGEYKTKGSLEMYGIGRVPESQSTAAAAAPEGSNHTVAEYRHNSTLKNRQTSSFSKLLSVANHGSRIVFSDGAGMIKWFERDGTTEVRNCKISGGDAAPVEEGDSGMALFDSADDGGDIARKLLPLRSANKSAQSSLRNNDLLFWTGERLGLVSFSSKPGSKPEDFEERAKTEEELAHEREERAYGAKMRQLLEKQANDVHYVGNLGFGSGGRR